MIEYHFTYIANTHKHANKMHEKAGLWKTKPIYCQTKTTLHLTESGSIHAIFSLSYLFCFHTQCKRFTHSCSYLAKIRWKQYTKQFLVFYFVWYVRFSFKKHIIFINLTPLAFFSRLIGREKTNNNEKLNGWACSHIFSSMLILSHFDIFAWLLVEHTIFIWLLCAIGHNVVNDGRLVSSRLDQTSLFVYSLWMTEHHWYHNHHIHIFNCNLM